MNPSLADIYPGAAIKELVINTVPGYSANNPSIHKDPDGGYRFVVRSSNFVLDPSGLSHQSTEPDVIRTKNYAGHMDESLHVESLEPIDYSEVGEADEAGWVTGIEDARIFYDYLTDSWRTSGTYRFASGVPTIAVDTLNDNNRVIDRWIYRDTPDTPQKNWMSTGKGLEFIKGPWNIEGEQHRGSSQVIWVDGYYLGVLHFCTWPGRMYWHRMACFTWQGKLMHLGPVFHFIEPGVEFCNGMELWNDQVVMTFGYREARCFLATVPRPEIMKRLYAVSS